MRSTVDLPTYLPGFDIKTGVARVSGNIQLYCELLQSFYDDKHVFSAQLNLLLQRGEQEAARALVHSVKGVAGNLSADALFVVAKELEDVLRNEQGDKLPETFEKFNKQFELVMESLRVFSESVSEQQRTQPEPLAVDWTEIKAVLNELAGLLAEFSMDAGDCFARLCQLLPVSDELETLADKIRDLEFDSALELLKNLNIKTKY